jgi:glutaredoxin 3
LNHDSRNRRKHLSAPKGGIEQSRQSSSDLGASLGGEAAIYLTSPGGAADPSAGLLDNCEMDFSGLVDVGMRGVLPLFMRNELTLYSRAMCSWCIDAKDFLHSRGYKFTEIDVGRDRTAYEEMKEISEQSYVPTLVVGEEVLANFDVGQLAKFLSEHRIEP